MKESLLNQLTAARQAAAVLNRTDDARVNKLLMHLADVVDNAIDSLLLSNRADLERMDKSNPKYDRLQLTEERLHAIASDLRSVAALPSPLGRELSQVTRPNGMVIRKVSVPFGVIGIIYEARPNVTFDVFSLCLKSGNACVLKGGSEAASTNEAIFRLIRHTLDEEGLPRECITLLDNDHDTTAQMLRATGYIDLVIPRGSRRLIDFVRDNAKVPVIETGAGVCHCYFDASGDLKKGRDIVNNAKTRRVSVCNALDCLLVDRRRLPDLAELVAPLASGNVVLRADEEAYRTLVGHYPRLEHADDTDFGMEYLDYKMMVRTVDGLAGAMQHIARYSSRHSESIVAEDSDTCATFAREVDAACVYTNLPTSFTDGGQFGFGAEIGISTQKLHARGPMALPEMTTYKYIISGDGQIREK